jgi:hypothetical protein
MVERVNVDLIEDDIWTFLPSITGKQGWDDLWTHEVVTNARHTIFGDVHDGTDEIAVISFAGSWIIRLDT